MILTLCFILVMLAYAAVILTMLYGIRRLKPVFTGEKDLDKGFSIVVPFRNEADNLPALLDSVSKLDYPSHLFELILVNDNSEDDFTPVLDDFRRKNPEIKLIRFNVGSGSHSPKKEAIQLAVNQSNHDWVITTDADCILPAGLLEGFSDLSVGGYQLIAGPVLYQKKSGMLSLLQYYDYLALQGLTRGGFGIGKPFLCSGANLAFSKSFFHELGGFKGNLDVASGDDLFILKKAIDHDPKKAAFLEDKNGLVLTQPIDSWNALINQRLRWIAKTRRVGSPTGTFVSLVGMLANLFLPFCLLLVVIGKLYWQFFLFGLILKCAADFILIFQAARSYGQKIVMGEIIVISVMYPLFVLVLALRSLFPLFQWKGRPYKA